MEKLVKVQVQLPLHLHNPTAVVKVSCILPCKRDLELLTILHLKQEFAQNLEGAIHFSDNELWLQSISC